MIKKHAKDLIVILVLAIVLTIAFTCMDIKSVDEYYSTPLEEITGESFCFSVDCITLQKKIEKSKNANQDSSSIKNNIEKYIPKDGIIISKGSYALKNEDTVFTVLQRITAHNKIPISFTNDATGNVYVRGIDNIFEKDAGGYSGWVYLVNGKMPNVGMHGFVLKNGDVVELRYTCEMGDIDKYKYE